MPRLARLVLPGVALHVVQRGHDRRACFRRETDYLVYLATLGELLTKCACALHAYCLMTNHVHLLLTPTSEESCASLMRRLGQRYVQYFNRRYERTGTLWEGRFRSCLVDSTRYVLACHRYIECNPVRAGMVPSSSGYRWSSHNGNSGRMQDPLLTPHVEYLALGQAEPARLRAYRQLFDGPDDVALLKALREATGGGFPLVGEGLKQKLVEFSSRPLERRKPGPPPTHEPPEVDRRSAELGF